MSWQSANTLWNRLGAVQPQRMSFALRRDVVLIEGHTIAPGKVM
ncbi:MAG: hypothetical protein V3T65_01855 [Acidobacteriota bacterium]